MATTGNSINAFNGSRLLLAFKDSDYNQVLFFSTPRQSCSSSVLVAEKKTLTIPQVRSDDYVCNSVRGFLCCRIGYVFMVCNPTTGQVIPLNDMNYDNYNVSMFLGYDPKSDQYKVLRIMSPKFSNSHVEHSVRTLGGQPSSNSWKPINTSILYNGCYPRGGVCIDGVVYYTCETIEQHGRISCFDVGSEQLSLIKTPEGSLNNFFELTNYLEKLAVYCYIDNGFSLWVLDDVKHRVWSKRTYIFQSLAPSMFSDFRFREVTSSGEIVHVARCYSDSLELFCFDVEKKRERKVKVEGLSEIGHLYPFILCSYVENLAYL